MKYPNSLSGADIKASHIPFHVGPTAGVTPSAMSGANYNNVLSDDRCRMKTYFSGYEIGDGRYQPSLFE